MHELAITESIVAGVAEHVGNTRVTRVVVEIGKLSGVVPDAVRFCFDVCAEGTVVEGAVLQIEEIPALASCHDCGVEALLDDFVALCACGSANLEFRSGQELRVREVEVA